MPVCCDDEVRFRQTAFAKLVQQLPVVFRRVARINLEIVSASVDIINKRLVCSCVCVHAEDGICKLSHGYILSVNRKNRLHICCVSECLFPYDKGMLDINENGVIDPEEEALGQLLAEEAGKTNNRKRHEKLGGIASILFGILLVIMIAALLFLSL